jgi:hypothetical protein
VVVGKSNIENERRLMLMKQRIVDVEDIVVDIVKAVDGLAFFFKY